MYQLRLDNDEPSHEAHLLMMAFAATSGCREAGSINASFCSVEKGIIDPLSALG